MNIFQRNELYNFLGDLADEIEDVAESSNDAHVNDKLNDISFKISNKIADLQEVEY